METCVGACGTRAPLAAAHEALTIPLFHAPIGDEQRDVIASIRELVG